MCACNRPNHDCSMLGAAPCMGCYVSVQGKASQGTATEVRIHSFSVSGRRR